LTTSTVPLSLSAEIWTSASARRCRRLARSTTRHGHAVALSSGIADALSTAAGRALSGAVWPGIACPQASVAAKASDTMLMNVTFMSTFPLRAFKDRTGAQHAPCFASHGAEGQ